MNYTEVTYLNENAGSYQSSPAYSNFYCTAYTRITGLRMYFRCRATGGGSATLNIKVNNVVVESHTVQIEYTDTTGKFGAYADFDVTLNIGDTFQLYSSNLSSHVDVIHSQLTEMFAWGHTDDALIMGWTDCAEMQVSVTYEAPFVLDAQNEGYPRLYGYPCIIFNEYSKDADGIPYNWGVWKFTAYNNGYPWIIPYDIAEPQAETNLYKKVNGTLYQAKIYKKVGVELIEAHLYKKVGNALIQIT